MRETVIHGLGPSFWIESSQALWPKDVSQDSLGEDKTVKLGQINPRGFVMCPSTSLRS